MKELLLMFGSVLPKEKLAEEVVGACNEWTANPTDDNWRKLEMFCQLILSKAVVDQEGGFEKAIDRINKHENAAKLYEANELNLKPKS